MQQLYFSLYGEDDGVLSYFFQMLERCFQNRNPSLRQLDEVRAKDPGWYRGNDLLGMMLYVDAFAGNLVGVMEKLPYLTECGVNYLHLMPLLETPKDRSDGGYAVSDFRRVQPELGTMAKPEFEKAVREHCEECRINLYKMKKDKGRYRLEKVPVILFDD